MKSKVAKIKFSNKVIDKYQLKKIIVWAFRTYGIARAANMVDRLKDLGFYYATKAGISLSLEDLRIPPSKTELLNATLISIEDTDTKHRRGEITAVERFQKVIDTWNNASEALKRQVIQYFKNTDPLNSIYMMAFSGARGNISQVRQLVGMRGLMSDPQGQIIDLPIASNFREGLTITDYFISSYGARKGLVDTALRTADSGYLTRRLVDVAQDIIIRESNCKTTRGILLESMIDNQKILIDLKQALVGRVLAEDVLDPISNSIIAYADQAVTSMLADKLIDLGVNKILVRSPITCDSARSVCQLCYGWNLAHGKMVDLGEAVGIIAAQSIGEPGTQLTMRTFHTGGVFTGELAQTITSPINGIVKYMPDMYYTTTRTRHGDSALKIKSDCKLKLVDTNNLESWIPLAKDILLLSKNNDYVKQGDIIAEYPLSYRTMTERAQKVVSSDYSGSIHISNICTEETKNKQSLIRSAKNDGIVWVLSGVVKTIPDNAELMVIAGQRVYENSILACTQLISRYSGRIKIIYQLNTEHIQQISVITSCKTFSNIKVYINENDSFKNYVLETINKDKFILKVSPNEKIINNQVIGDLCSNVYKTNTGGIIKYLDLPVSKKKTDLYSDYYDILGPGYILWIPEETHEVNKDISLLLIQNGEFVEVGTEIIKNVFANNSGILEVIHKDGIIREIVIKPGKIYKIDNQIFNKKTGKYRGFLRPGQYITTGIMTDKLVYWEYLSMDKQDFILIRPVIVYSVPSKILSCEYDNDAFATHMFNIEIVRRTQFRDGARIKSINGINLITTHLVSRLHRDIGDMYCSMEFLSFSKNSKYFLMKLVTADILPFKEINYIDDNNFYTKKRIKVKDGQYISSGSVIYQTEILSSIEGTIEVIQDHYLSSRRLLIVSPIDTRKFVINNDQLVKVKCDDWVYVGDEIATNLVTFHSGKVLTVRDNQIVIRIGQPYLISKDSILHVEDRSLIKRGENIATLIFERAKTGDIVQGLPRIEEILEARKKSDNSFNPHVILESNFRAYVNQGLSLYDATRLSLLQIQLFLVKEIQLVYQAQGVDIADKHIEVIIRQMTSKVKIENGGDTGFLPGEMLELQKIESVNQSLYIVNKEQASYYPVILGITKASLSTESFISAASFQETTKVLTEAAISGKLDWLRGLKENVIIGRLIPAGTGFNIYSNPLLQQETSVLYTQDLSLSNKQDNRVNFEDIIVDDRSAHIYPNFDSNNI
uniref:DNA-directed RNA polymerase n=1 Tax=Riquetophycus sp. TaxID=1897556 RepID=A0A1C9C810_9FLOR|nr:RNA polymerase beta'' subunit [Riquetophycus sp.]